MSIAFHTVRLRANPFYRAAPWNRVAPDAREALLTLADGYGVLIPRDGAALPLVAVDRDTALLFLTLQDPGPAPDFMFLPDAQAGGRVLARLVLDRILEVEQPDGFVSGPEACSLMGVDAMLGAGCVARLSVEAVRYGAALHAVDAIRLAHRLYGYNTRPTTPALRRKLPDRDAYLGFLGLDRNGNARSAIERFWLVSTDTPGWLVFSPKGARPRNTQRPCKLYIGLALEELPACLPVLATELGCSAAMQFKIGADLAGLLRPDKLVAYFPDKEALLAAAQVLLPMLAGRRVHAVPFSAEIGAEGALSWGMDPQTAWLGDRTSWRQWICEKLAGALVMARQGKSDGVESWLFALERLRLEGVDTATFMPTGNWSEAA